MAGFEGIRFQSYAQLELGYFHRLGDSKWFTANIVRGRLTTPQNQPYKYRYALGSESEYVRGYEYYVIDGSQYGVLRNNLKYELLNVRVRNIPIRYLPVLPLRIYPKVFIDAGYVDYKYTGNSFLNNRMLYSAGMGLDIITAYDLKFRLEYTWNHLGQKGLFLHINSE
jgi:hemolysin activation/secretion protein